MLSPRPLRLLLAALLVAVHAWGLWGIGVDRLAVRVPLPVAQHEVVMILPAATPIPPPAPPMSRPPLKRQAKPPTAAIERPVEPPPIALADTLKKAPATLAAPATPSTEEWAMAGQYTLKNSKRYRHNWGQHVRSLMGTAVEGPDQGAVRFEVEIAPDGRLARLDTLWSTSAKAEQLARQAIQQMPPLPPTPTGKPLVFQRTVSFQPYETDGPPLYKNDCKPDASRFSNPFAWDGQAAQARGHQAPPPPMSAQELAECLKQLPKDSLEAESAQMRRQLEQGWSSSIKR
ncbi:energy transducer TonB family protein [Ideonella paludis]|nr:energy transducer TonB [Ideonella paludis]